MQQQAYQAYTNTPKGTLVPGQTISVNKYTVQVERYLSQGGFSHVYLVRTPTPVYNTTHHVLKRIAVANEAMLTEVRKEVDIMRILKGHPNIVYLIDAAWHKMANGMFEVFILMEFCPGGGIIDMMNRRLRERLTEAEILQIFVDVCEGVAAMHNLRPALLHRDLKVENILQASNNCFKLCDFGSATPVAPRPPSTTQEIRALEADLNRHTTLQYRAPEMVDSYLRRPVDEKSDVWALGVLLYKLCYYTTPFEEHGQLAILNVQYRIPPYPVYSSHLNGLIASMLREHGTQRPSAFELLAQVHRMRGTKSRFTYNMTSPPPLSSRPVAPPIGNPMDNLVSYRSSSGQTQGASPLQPKSSGTAIQAREKVLEAIAPMRRGRPSSSRQNDSMQSLPSRPPSPHKNSAESQTLSKPPQQNWLEDNFKAEGDDAVKSNSFSQVNKARGPATTKSVPNNATSLMDDAWSVETRDSKVTPTDQHSPTAAFGDNFAEKLWNAYDSPRTGGYSPNIPSNMPPLEGSRNTRLTITKGKDAFEGLGLSPPEVPALPTLGEARKLRTGLAVVNGSTRLAPSPAPSMNATKPNPSPAPRPTPSPRPTQPTSSSSWKSTPVIPQLSNNPPSLPQLADFTAETRFPSLEELDATFGSSSTTFIPPTHSTSQPALRERSPTKDSGPSPLGPPLPTRPTPKRSMDGWTNGPSGTRSQHVTGVAMRDSKEDRKMNSTNSENVLEPSSKRHSYRPISRPSLSRKHRSSISIKHTPQSDDLLGSRGIDVQSSLAPPKKHEPQDWLTGDNDTGPLPLEDNNRPHTPILREFTNKRSSFIEENTVPIQSPQEAVAARMSSSSKPSRAATPPSPSKKKPVQTPRTRERKPSTSGVTLQKVRTPDVTGPQRASTENWSLSKSSFQVDKTPPSSDEDHPEEPTGFPLTKSSGEDISPKRRRTRGRQNSVHDLVDLWGGGVVQTKERPKDSVTTLDFGDGDYRQHTGAKLYKSKSVAIPPASKQLSNPSPPVSNNSLPTAIRRSPSKSPRRAAPPSHIKQASIATPMNAPTSSSSSSRIRPQSMLAFPMSKSASEGKSDSATGLAVPPDNSRKHGSRRTSITDMVQRYEAIGGGMKGPGSGQPPPVLPKPVALKVATPNYTGTGGRFVGLPAQSSSSPVLSRFTGSRGAASASPISDDKIAAGESVRSNLPSTVFPKSTVTGDGFGGKPGEPSNQTSSIGLTSGLSNKPFNFASRERTTAPDGLPSLSSPFPLHKGSPPADDPQRSPSPDKPYQGVGRLIDQWQRKTIENDTSKRGGPVSRRAGLVSGAGKDGPM
ncbi:hypothetical protein BJ138DRAFT_1143146 [Hygrophoropsis aurantiaca]|uniref:Uncharacterized protein n=1 Tax=Hygrophoropsis aurantiaca TaxID=72124 RepID=A0ACB8APR8_9AGAM|nr:hypothetical protein BJ138DRAFT_1143146 [Hygrophoropsis aurantiaca]